MNYAKESRLSLERLLNDLDMQSLSKTEQKEFKARLGQQFPRLFKGLHQVYGWQYDFYYHLQQLIQVLFINFNQRSRALKSKDRKKLAQTNWYKDNKMLGMACYVDLFGGDLKGLKKRIPYLLDLGVNYLHLMPLYDCPTGDSDGGYAVSDYRQVMTKLGTMDDLRALASALNKAGINLVLDFVFNHTSDEHQWAQKAQQGDEYYQSHYYMFDNKDIPNQYEQNLREIFPQVRRGSFSFNHASNKWVWTTFNNFQWDLNYSNPIVFNAIVDEMLFLANVGADALRLDALAFIWKELGTNCENQEKAHTLIQCFNACLQIVSPSVVFKSEAIVHPDEVIKYIDKDECQLSYNPLLMALIWNSLATRKTRLITASLQKTGTISDDCAWVNYARCHDDIGWTFDDQVAADLGINGDDHRRFLNQFYTGKFPGSFANGVAFAENPLTGDCRVCGSLASLCGLETALETQDQNAIELAVKRILLVHSIIMSIGGIPLIYAGDEFALLNDYSYEQDPSKAHDQRWVHRVAVPEHMLTQEYIEQSLVLPRLKAMIKCRQSETVLGDAKTRILPLVNSHCFGYERVSQQGETCVCMVNFSEQTQTVPASLFKSLGKSLGRDLLSGRSFDLKQALQLQAYEFLWLV